MDIVQKIGFLFFILLLPMMGNTQEDNRDSLQAPIEDLLYREDQIYFSVTYNLLMDPPSGMTSRGLTGGLNLGFLRDMPINESRNIAFAVGLGWSYDHYGHNLFIGEDSSGNSIYRILDGKVVYTDNHFSMAVVEVPIEFRWRTSTAKDYKFWRIYGGARLGYAYYYKSTFVQSGNNVNQTEIPEFNPVRISATLSFGYDTFNFFASYSINPFFKDAYTVNGEKIDLRTLKVGLIFYLL